MGRMDAIDVDRDVGAAVVIKRDVGSVGGIRHYSDSG